MTMPPNGFPPAGAAGAAGGPASSPRRDRMLSELAGELRAARDEHRRDVEQLRTDLAGVSTLVGENADLLGQVLPRVSDLDVELADLAERLDALAAVVAAGPSGRDTALVDWPSLSADAAAAEWQALADWVAGVLGPFYELTRAQLPDCWALHRPAVLEMVWLRRTYVAAHRPDAAPGAAADWHTRWRREALANIAAAIPEKWCRPGEHWVDRYERARPAGGPPPPAPPRHVPGQRPGHELHSVGAGGEISAPQHWGPAFQTAAGEDIAWRRQRDTAAAATQ
jgi:hypothetical protein